MKACNKTVNTSPQVDDANRRGLPPKTAARIRATLRRVHAASDQTAKPGTVRGISKDDWITVASWSRLSHAMREGIRALNESGINVRQVWQADCAAIQVPRKCFDEAKGALRVASKSRRRPHWLMVGELRIYRLTWLAGEQESGIYQLLWGIGTTAFVIPAIATLVVILVYVAANSAPPASILPCVFVWIVVTWLSLSFFMWKRRAPRVRRSTA